MLSLPVLVGFVVYYLIVGRVELDWEAVFFPLGMVLQFGLLVGLGLILAPITVLATDMQRVVRIVLRFMFYLSPILYGIHSVPEKLREKLRAVLFFNPLNGILSLYRGGLFERGISWIDVGVSVVITVILLVVGFWTFSRLERPVLKEI